MKLKFKKLHLIYILRVLHDKTAQGRLKLILTCKINSRRLICKVLELIKK